MARKGPSGKKGGKKGGKKMKATGLPAQRIINPNSFKRTRFRTSCGFLAVVAFITAISLSAAMLAGCTTTAAGGKDLYVVNIQTTTTQNPSLELRVGYFGACLSINETHNGSSNPHCMENMRGQDVDNIAEELYEDMNLGSQTTQVQNTLVKLLLPIAVQLQNDVFHWAPPVFHLVAFAFSGLILFQAVSSPTSKRAYRFWVVSGVLLGAVALSLAFVTSVGAVEVSNVLVGNNTLSFGQGISVQTAGMLQSIRIGQAALVGSFYVFIAALFVNTKSMPGYSV